MKKYEDVNEYIADLKANLAKNPGCGNTHYNLGVAYLNKRDFAEAERSFREAVHHSPKMAEGYVQLGGIAMQRGDLDGCLNFNVEATKIRPFFAVPWGNIGFVLMQKGESDKAIANLKKALKYDPNFVQAMATLGTAHYHEGDFDECIRVCSKAVEIQPKFAPAYNNMALCYLEKGDVAMAREMADKAIETGFDVAPELLEEIRSQEGGDLGCGPPGNRPSAPATMPRPPVHEGAGGGGGGRLSRKKEACQSLAFLGLAGRLSRAFPVHSRARRSRGAALPPVDLVAVEDAPGLVEVPGFQGGQEAQQVPGRVVLAQQAVAQLRVQGHPGQDGPHGLVQKAVQPGEHPQEEEGVWVVGRVVHDLAQQGEEAAPEDGAEDQLLGPGGTPEVGHGDDHGPLAEGLQPPGRPRRG